MEGTESIKKKVLVVDDDIPLQEMYQERLELAGFDVKTASDGQEGIEQAREYRPDLILLDVMMPRANGFDVLAILRKEESTSHIPVLMLTALVQESAREKAREAGAQGYIIKSETMPGEVIKKIQETLSKINQPQIA